MKYVFVVLICILSLLSYVHGHASLIKPCPRFDTSCSSESNLPSGEVTDPDIRSPIGSATSGTYSPLCKTSKEWKDVVDTLEAGSSYTVKFSSESISHSGGHCEFSISYDGGETFVVLYQVLKFCFVGSQPSAATNEVSVFDYTFDLPQDLPGADRAIFAWTWVNASGNREFYMNCADVSVTGSSTSLSGKGVTYANYEGYETIPEFGDDYTTGLKLYDMSLNPVTVTSSGGSGKTSNTKDSNSSKGSKSSSISSSSSSKSSSSSDIDNQSSSSSDDTSEAASSVSVKPIVNKNAIINTSVTSDTGDDDLEKCDMDETGDYSDVSTDVSETGDADYEYVCDTGESSSGSTEDDEYDYVCDTGNGSSETATSDDDDYVCDTGEETPSDGGDDDDYVCDTGPDGSSGEPSPSTTSDASPDDATSTGIAGPVWNSSEEPDLVCDGSDDDTSSTSDAATESISDNSSNSSGNTLLSGILSSIAIGNGQSGASSANATSSASPTSSELEQSAKSSAPTTTEESSAESETESSSSRTFVLYEYSGVSSADVLSGSVSDLGSSTEVGSDTTQSQSSSQLPTSSPLPTASSSSSQ